MKRSRYGYTGYRGRSRGAKWLKILVVCLAVVLCLVVGAYFWLQQYLVYTSDGVRLELPFGRQEQVQQDETPQLTVSPDLVRREAEENEPQTEPLRALEVSPDGLTAEDAQAAMEAAGANALVLTVKSGDGQLHFQSETPQAAAMGVNGGADLNETVAQLKTQGVYLVARLDCFEDDALAQSDPSPALLTHSGYRWTGPNGWRWVVPGTEGVQDYLAALAGELAALGFDEILLENAAYPGSGNLDYIQAGEQYDAARFGEVLAAFYSRMQEAAASHGARLSLLTEPAALTEEGNALTGQSLAVLSGSFARVWSAPGEADAAALSAALAQAGLGAEGENYVELGDFGENNLNQAVIFG